MVLTVLDVNLELRSLFIFILNRRKIKSLDMAPEYKHLLKISHNSHV